MSYKYFNGSWIHLIGKVFLKIVLRQSLTEKTWIKILIIFRYRILEDGIADSHIYSDIFLLTL